MFPFDRRFLVIGEPVFDDPTRRYPSFDKDVESVVALQGLAFGETGLIPPCEFARGDFPDGVLHFEYRIYKGKSSLSEYEPIEFEYFRNESTLRVHSNIPEIKALPIVELIAECYLGVLIQDEATATNEVIVQCRSMDPCFKCFEMAAKMLSERILSCIEQGESDIENQWWMKAGLELLTKRPKASNKSVSGPMRIGFDYPESVRVIELARRVYEALYAWISECHPEQFDIYRRDYNSLAGQALDIFESLRTEEDWVYRFFTQAESPRGEKYNIYNPKPFECLYQVCLKHPKRLRGRDSFADTELFACPTDEQGRLKVVVDGVTPDGAKAMRGAMKGAPKTREDVIAFVRSLYDKANPKLSSWPKVVEYVRTVKDRRDPNFAECANVQALVQGFSKKEKFGIDAAWRSIAQEAKPSHGRKRKKPNAAPGPVPILCKGADRI